MFRSFVVISRKSFAHFRYRKKKNHSTFRMDALGNDKKDTSNILPPILSFDDSVQ